MSRLEQLRVSSPILTQLARGYTNANLIGTMLFHVAEVIKESGKIPQFTREAFKVFKTERGLGADSNRIIPEDRQTIDIVLSEHDLEYPVDYRETMEDEFDAEKNATYVVTEAINLKLEKMIADLAQDLTSYPAENKVTLAGQSKWSDYANSTPVLDVDNAKEVIRSKIGRRPNLMVLGASTYKILRHHTKLLELVKYSQKGILTIDLLKEIFDIDNIVVGEGVYTDSNGQVFTDLWGDNCILAFMAEQEKQSIYNPAFAYTVRKKG